jgi:hypothetical protein
VLLALSQYGHAGLRALPDDARADPSSTALYDTALTRSFDQTEPLLIAVIWLTALAVTVTVPLRHTAGGFRPR